jgi:hypothetical protein
LGLSGHDPFEANVIGREPMASTTGFGGSGADV